MFVIFPLCVIILLLIVGIAVLIRQMLVLLTRIEEHEKTIEEYNGYIDNVRSLLETIHFHFEKISHYPIASNDPIVQKMTKLVSESRDKLYNLIDQINSGE